MATEGAGRSKFTELVTNHCFRNEDRHVLTAVMHCNSVPQEIRGNDGPARPGLNNVLRTLIVLLINLLQEMLVNEGSLL